MRADRLLSIMLLLQVHRHMTARELATRLEVSERTIYRDVEALGSAGIPITTERGTGGGLRLLEAFRTNLTGLNLTEIQALFLGQPMQVLHDLGLHRASEGAFIKLLAGLPEGNRPDAETTRQRIYIDLAGWRQGEQEQLQALPLLQEAVWRERKVSIWYQRGEQPVERVLHPLGLVVKGRIWYLVAAIDESFRCYRVSRIQAVTLLDEGFERPPDFDLAAYWHESSSQFLANIPRLAITVRLTESASQRILQMGRVVRFESISPLDEQGYMTLCLYFDPPLREITGYLLSFGAELEVLAPQEARAQIYELAREVVAAYETWNQRPGERK